ncbi:MAG: ABC transporter permease [Bacillota bacterium]
MSGIRNRIFNPSFGLLPVISRLAVLLAIIVFGFCIDKSFLSMRNISNNITNASILIILGIGQTIAIITSGPDLSSSSVMTICAVITAILMKNHNVNFVISILVALLCGAMLGALNGYMVSYVGIPSFISTYGLRWAVFGFAYVILQGYVLYNFNETFRFIGTGKLFGFLQMPIVIMIAFVILIWFLLKKTNFGRKCYAVGSNSICAVMSGINSKNTVMGAFIVSALLSAFAGVLFVARENAVQADIGNAYLLPVLAAVFMGGTSPKGGEGGILGTIVGAFIITIITNCMNLLAVPSEWRDAIIGILIIVTVLLDSIIKKRIARRQTAI